MNLEYEALDERHVKDLIPIWSDEEVIFYTNIKAPCSLEEIGERIHLLKCFEVFVVRNQEEVIGIIGCPCISRQKLQYGLFYQFKKAVWGRGYGTQAVEWLLGYMRKKYNGAVFFTDVAADNTASRKILEHLGFKLISEEDSFERSGIKMAIRNYRV